MQPVSPRVQGNQVQPAVIDRIPLTEHHRRCAEDPLDFTGDDVDAIPIATQATTKIEPPAGEDLWVGNAPGHRAGFDLHGLLHNQILIEALHNLHRAGQELHSACPECGGGDRSDRFTCTPKTGYGVWWCRQCGHTTSTARLLGIAWDAAPRPAIRAWHNTFPNPQHLDAIASIYESLAEFAGHAARLDKIGRPRFNASLLARGMTSEQATGTGLGYIDGRLYKIWYGRLSGDQRQDASRAGLPDGSKRLNGFGRALLGGRQGKTLFAYRDEGGRIVDIRTRSIGDDGRIRYMSPKGGQLARGANVPYGVEGLVEKTPRVVLTEGEFKRLTPMTQGCKVPILSLRGTSDPVHEYLRFFCGRLVILAFDNDQQRDKRNLTPGEAAMVRIGRQLIAHDIDVMCVDLARYGRAKGIDDFVLAHDIDAFNQLLLPANLLTLSEFEACLVRDRKADLSKFTKPKSDIGTVRQWTPQEYVHTHAHAQTETMSLEDAQGLIEKSVQEHVGTWQRGHEQLLITAPPGTGKTYTTIQEARKHAEANGETIAVMLPNHSTIDEKIASGELAGFQHIYGRRNDDEIQNCEQAETAQVLTKYGYSPGVILCPECPVLAACQASGYKSQFNGQANRAYVHAHLHSSYPEHEDLVIIDELTHRSFMEEMVLYVGDLSLALQNAQLRNAQRTLLEALVKLFGMPDIGYLTGAVLYQVLEREYADLHNVDAWGDGLAVQTALADVASEFASRERGQRNTYEAEQLPIQFGERLFSVLAEDIRQIRAGKTPTGRLRLETTLSGTRRLVLTTSRGAPPAWFYQRPTIILNATADADIMRDIVGPLKVIAPNVAVQDGNKIIQNITKNNAKSSLIGTSDQAQNRRDVWLDDIRQQIAAHKQGETDTVIISTKQLAPTLQKEFPQARVSYYMGLEGRNDLQAGLTILANAPAVNLEAVKREAVALYPGIKTTMTRERVAFAETNAAGELLAVEQIAAVDPRVQAILDQHRDAVVIQAVHRARLLRESGRTVVVMFARPIPGLRPSVTIIDRPTAKERSNQRSRITFNKLLKAARELVEETGGFTLSTLSALAKCARKTAIRYWDEICLVLRVTNDKIGVRQPLHNGGSKHVEMWVAIDPPTLAPHPEGTRFPHDVSNGYNIDIITLGNVVQSYLPHGWILDDPRLAQGTDREEKDAPQSPQPISAMIACDSYAEALNLWQNTRGGGRIWRDSQVSGRHYVEVFGQEGQT